MEQSKQNRIAGIDVIRFFAIFFVLGIHSMGFLGFHSHEVTASKFVEIFIFRFTWMCVPLFLLLTGYLNSRKEGNKAYFKSILNTALIFLFYSVLVVLFRHFYQNEGFTLWQGIKMFFNFTTQDRAWYMNMYFGLVLLVPFINKGWSLFDKKQKMIIIGVLFLLTSVSKYVFKITEHYFETPFVLISDYWWGLYFLVYYLIGAFVREYPIQISKKILTVSLLLLMIGHTIVYIIAGQGGTFVEIYLSSIFWYDNPFLVIETTLFFLLLYNVDIKNKTVKLVNKEMSLSAFEMYLFSIITDTMLVGYFASKLNGSNYLWIVSLMWISSFALSFFATFLRRKVIRFL